MTVHTLRTPDGLTHRVVDMDKQRRNGRTGCAGYVAFASKQLHEGGVVTCLRCISNCSCAQLMEAFGPAFLVGISGHDSECAVDRHIHDSWENEQRVIAACVQDGEHQATVDDDGFCEACGYQ